MASLSAQHLELQRRRRSALSRAGAWGHALSRPSQRRLKPRRRFGAVVAGLGVILLGVGIALARGDGLVRVIGLVCLAYGLGFGVSGIFLVIGWNPLDRRGANGSP